MASLCQRLSQSSSGLQSYLADSIILALSFPQSLEVFLVPAVAVGAPEVPGAVTVGQTSLRLSRKYFFLNFKFQSTRQQRPVDDLILKIILTMLPAVAVKTV